MPKVKILLDKIVSSIQDMKGKEIISLNLQKTESNICKYFVICTGTSNIHVSSISDNQFRNISQISRQKCHRTAFPVSFPSGSIHFFDIPVRLRRNFEKRLANLVKY